MSKYNNWLIAKQIYTNMEKRREEREELTLTNKLDTEAYAMNLRASIVRGRKLAKC
jgi:hypothetical protein